MPRKPKVKRAKQADIVAKALWAYASRLMNSDSVDAEEAKALDRALRCCKGVQELDTHWVRWGYQSSIHGWCTAHEIQHGQYGFGFYPDTDPEVQDEP